MDLDFRHVLVDGTLRSPAVWVALAISTALLCAVGALLVRLLLPPRAPRVVQPLFWLPAVPLLLVAVWLTNGFAFGLVFLGSFTSAGLCLMPTHHPVRDFLPFTIAVSATHLLARRRLRTLAAA